MLVTLTFDNGPDPTVTPAVLDELAARSIPAYFFVVGSMLQAPGASEALAAAHDAGHLIGNHSLTHRVPFGDDPDADNVRREIDETERLLGERNERRLFRPFGGGGHLGPHLFSPAAVPHLAAGGYTAVLWNAVPRDWERVDDWVEVAIEQCRRLDHAVVVLHDLPTGAMRQLPRFLDALDSIDAACTLDLPADVLPIVDGEIVDVDGMIRT